EAWGDTDIDELLPSKDAMNVAAGGAAGAAASSSRRSSRSKKDEGPQRAPFDDEATLGGARQSRYERRAPERGPQERLTLSGSFIPPSPRGLFTRARAICWSACAVGESGSETTSGTPRSAPSRRAGSSPTRHSTGTSCPTARASAAATRSTPPV